LDLHTGRLYASVPSKAQSSGLRARKGYLVQRSSESRIDPTVFYVSLLVVLAFVAWGVFFTDNIATVTGAVRTKPDPGHSNASWRHHFGAEKSRLSSVRCSVV
jgi:hypothetical protein